MHFLGIVWVDSDSLSQVAHVSSTWIILLDAIFLHVLVFHNALLTVAWLNTALPHPLLKEYCPRPDL